MMHKKLIQKIVAFTITIGLLALIFLVLTPPPSIAVFLYPGTPSSTSVTTTSTVIFNDVNLTIRQSEAVPVNSLSFSIRRSNDDSEVAYVTFSIKGTEQVDPAGRFTVTPITDTSTLPYQTGGPFNVHDEQTESNSSFNFGYGPETTDLIILYRITYTTHITGTFYGQLNVNTTSHTYVSGESLTFTVSGQSVPLIPTVTVTNQTLWAIATAYNVILEQEFYGSDTNDDGIADVFVDPNSVLTATGLVILNGNATFLLSTTNDNIPELFWDTATNTMTSITYTPAPLTTPIINTTAKTVLIEITVDKTGWIYLGITDQYPIDEYPAYNLTVKAGTRTVPSDRIWRKDGKIYILDDPAASYDLIYEYTILPPTFHPSSGTTVTTGKPTITITYPSQVYMITALLDNAMDITSQFMTIGNAVFTYTPTSDLTKGTHTLSLTVQDDQGLNTLTSTATYTVNIPETGIDMMWIIAIIIAIILIISVVAIFLLRKSGYF